MDLEFQNWSLVTLLWRLGHEGPSFSETPRRVVLPYDLPHPQSKDVTCLHTSDRTQVLALVAPQLRALAEAASAPRIVTLGQLCERYLAECELLRDNGPAHRADTDTRIAILLGYFGAERNVQTLSKEVQRRYERVRVAGGIQYTRQCRVWRCGRRVVGTVTRLTPPTRARSAEADLVLLHTMLNWATTARAVDGSRWLDANPLRGVARRPEKNRRQPVTSHERFILTRRAIQARVEHAAADSSEQVRWIKTELALVLAEATGRRIGAIRQLRWEDVNYERVDITWRADADKIGMLWVIPLTTVLVGELRHFQKQLGAVAGWVFPAERLVDQPMDRHQLEKWLVLAEHDAGLPKLIGGVWHPYRRKWAMERKHWPITDVAAVGGWKDIKALLTSYSQADRDTMQAVMDEPMKLSAAALLSSQLATREPWHPPIARSTSRAPKRPARPKKQTSRPERARDAAAIGAEHRGSSRPRK
jgi:integrase